MNDEENLQKIMMMGFTDEENIRAVLKSCSSDVNEAISLLASEGTYSGNSCNFLSDNNVVNEQVSEDKCSGRGDTSVEKDMDPLDNMIKGHDISRGFTSFEFNRLQNRISTEQWDIPCLRSQSLGLCLLGTIHEIKVNGLKIFDLYPEAERFLTSCLKECVSKLMTSQAVYNWDRDTLEGVHNMLELIVRLICEYMSVLKVKIIEEIEGISDKKDHDEKCLQLSTVKAKRIQSISLLNCGALLFTEPFQLLSMIFDCETNYHQLCRDRSNSTGTYADPFNDWSQISRSYMGNIVFADTLPTPRNFYLVNLLNCFGVYNGFNLLSWFATQTWSNINLTSIFLLPMAKCADYLTLYTLENYAIKVMYRVIWRLSNLSVEDFKDRDSRIFELVTSIRVLTYRLIDLDVADSLGKLLTKQECNWCLGSLIFTVYEPDWEEVISRYRKSSNQPLDQVSLFSISVVDKLHYSLLLSAISPPQGVGGATFNGRMMALRELIQQIEVAKQFGNLNNALANGSRHGQKRTRPTVPLTSASLLATENAAFLAKRQKRRVLRLDQLMSWIQDNEVIAKSLHKLDNTAYMATLSNFFRSLGERITNEDLTTLWHRTSHQNGAAVDNILNLLTDLASSRFTQSQLKHLFFLVELSWMNLDLQAITQTFPETKSPDSLQSNGKIRVSRISSPPPDEPSTIRHARARLLNMVGRIGITTRDPNTADMCIELLWRLAHSNYSEEARDFTRQNRKAKLVPQKMSFVERILVSHGHKVETTDSISLSDIPKYVHPEPIEAALAQQLVIIREFHCSGVDQRIRAMRWLLEAIGYISKNSLTFFMLAYVKSLLEFILKNFIGKAKRDHLHELNRSHELITRVVDSLLHYEKSAISSHGDLLTADSLDELGFRHSDVIKRHFDLLHYLLRNAELTLSVERAKALWETLIGQTRAAPFDREQAFIWFSSCLNFLDTDAQTFVFTKVILKSNPGLFRSIAGFECFKGFFEKVNLNEGRMKHVAKSWHVERPDLIGLDFLWDLYLALPSSDASLDGGHSNRPVDSETIMRSTSDIDNSTGNKPQLGSPSKQSTTTAILFSSLPASKPTPDAAKPARLLLLNVHWGQLAPKLRRDPESCYRRFFDTCRRRLEANYALGRGLITEYGVTSVLAETGELLAALMLGLGPATKAKHCSRTAAKLAIRRLLGLVYAFIQSVEDEMFGSRSYLPNWKPHGCTYRGWDMHLLVKIETVKQGQPHVSVTNLTTVGSQSVNKLSTSTSNILTDFYQHSDHIEPISLLAHSNEPLSSIRDRAYLASSAFLFASQSQPNYQQDSCLSPSWTVATLSLEEAPKPKVSFLNESRKPIKKTMFSHDTSGQHAENKSINREKPSQLLDTVLNRKPIGELGFQIGRHLVVRFYAEANPRSRSRVSTTSAVSSVTTTAPGLSSNSPYNSSFSLAGPYSSTLELTSEYLNNPTSLPNTYNLTSDESSRLLSSFRKRLEIPSFSSSFLTKGSSLLSLNAKQSVVELPADSNQAQPNSAHVSNVNIILPSVCLGQDSAVYELLFELAESELVCLHSPSRSSNTLGKKHHPSTSTSSGTYFSSTFGFIHPVRLLLACLPTYKSLRCERNGSGGMHLQYSLVCNPYTLLNSSPYRVLYKLQLLSSVLLPIDSSPWWETSPGCLLSPPSSAYFISYPSHSSTVSQAYKLLESVSVGSNLRSSSTGRRPSQSRVQPMNGDSKCDWFLSVDAINVNSQSSNSTSAPPSPILSSRRSLKVFSAFPRSTDVFSSKGKSQKNTPKDLSLVADAPLIEYIEALVQLLERNLIPFFPTSPHKIPNSTKKHNSPFPFVLRSCHTHRHFDASEGEFTISSEFHNTATDNTNWWRREVRHLCLQLIASLLNPVTSGSNDINSNRHFTTTVHNSRKGSITPEQISVLPSDSLVYQISSSLASSLLNALLETALVSAGIDVELLDHTLTKQQPYLSTTSVQSMNRLNTFLSHVDSRSGVAGIIEAISYFGRKVLFQDVEISVQCIRLYFQCIIAYPSTFVDVLLKSVNLEDKFIKLLVYSPSERVRGEMARQLEQLCILVSPYLYTGSTCFLVPNSSQCSLHSFVRNPEILNLILKAILHTSLPFSDVKLDIMSSSTANILISQCAEYFRVRGFLLGQTPVRILKENFNTDHITILQNDLSWFRKMMDFDNDLLSYQIIISDCLLAGHLDSVRLFCAQLVASVSSHFMCTFSDNGSSAFLSVMDKPASGLNHSNFSRNESTTDSQLLPSVKLLEALAKPSVLTTNLYEGNKCQSTLNNEFTKTMIPIHSSAALKIATECLYLSRDFIYYLVVECLFPAARYLLSDQATKELLLNAPTSSSSQKFSKREHLRRTLSALSKHCNLPQLDAFKSALPLTKKAALSFLSFVCRIDCQSLEKLVNLLILLHHSHKPDEIGPKLDTSSITMPGSICSSEITDRNSNKNTTEEFSNPQKASSIPQNMTGKADVHWDVQPIVVGRAECGFVGLRNGGATCYMNSVLQQLFMQPGVAETLLAVTDTDDTDEKNILFQTQRLFGHLLQSQREYFDPVGFWKSFRPWSTNVEINPFEQQDAFDFFQALIDQLDDGLKKMKRAPFFQALYQGIFLDSKFCDECDHRYDREEVFSAINLAVKANDLHEALNQFVRGEVLEGDNAYYCERCCVKRRAVKRLSIHTLPPVLCLHLKRFDFDWDRQIPVKFSHYFKFPRQLDMSPYLTGSIQKFRSAAFFSPHSSTSALLQRAAKEDIPSPDPDNSKTNDDEKSNVDVNKSTERNVDIENPVTFSNSPPSSPTSSRSGIYSFLEMPSADNIEETEVEKNDALKATISPNIPLSSYKKPSNNEATDNIYKLVGVVVHSGQANSGHYYSFIKDRRSKTLSRPPIIFQNNEQVTASTNNQNTSIIYQSPDHSVQSFETSQLETISENQSQMERLRTHHTTNNLKDSVENWYRFNDTCVEPVELTDDLLEHECFGGTYKVIGNDGKSVETRTRYWSAYLLFYERIDIHCSVYKQPETVSDSLSNQQTDLQIEEHRDERNLDPDLSHNDQSQAGIKSNKQRSENSSSIMTTSTTINKTKSVLMPTPIAQQIWTENMIFLRDQNVYSYEYFKFVRDLCEGILTDVGSLRQEPERGVLGTKLISHFLFNTFLCLHPRVKLSMALNSSELVTSLSATTVSEISTKLNSDLLGLLTRLATTNPNAARCLMHFLYVSPNQPCLVSMLLDPKPVARQQSANMILTVLQAFYSFKETNILDGALTGLINYLLGLFDNGQIVEHLTEAGALFAMLRGYAEMCPHATVHLSNLKATKRLLNFFIEPNPPSSFSPNETPVCYPSFTGNAPDWTHKLRVWSPAQHREMGNLYYLLTIMLRQTSFDAYRIPDTSSVHDAAPHPSLAHRQSSQSRLLLRPQKETVLWLGLSMPPLTNHILELSSTTNRYSTQLVGLFRLCEVLLKAYLENPVIPSLTSSLGLGDGLSYTSSVTSGGGASTTSLSNTANSAGPCPTTAFSELPIVMGGEPVTLRQRIRELMVHISANSWDASQCFIIALLDRIHSRPQSELRQYFDLLGELLRYTDPIQPARIIAVIDGLTNQKIFFDSNKWVWSPRPNGDPKMWAWNTLEMEGSISQSNEVIAHRGDEEISEHGPPQVVGLLDLIHADYSQDPRRAYQCTKFIVELSTQNTAVVKYLSHFPEKWEPIVKWLQNLMESAPLDDCHNRKNSFEMSSLCRYDSVDRETDLGNTDSDGIYIDVRTGLTSTRKPGSHLSGSLLQTSNEYGETSAGFQRTASAQTTLREATRILSTMPRSNNSEATGLSSAPTPLMMLPAGGGSVAMDDDDDDDDGSRYHDKKVDLFLRLST